MNQGIKRFLPLGFIDWDDKMYTWTYFDWSYLVLSVALKCHLQSLVHIMFTIKLFKNPDIDNVNVIEANMKQNIDMLLEQSIKFNKFFGGCRMLTVRAAWNHLNDIACRFDRDIVTMSFLKRTFGIVIENRTQNPAFSYYISETVVNSNPSKRNKYDKINSMGDVVYHYQRQEEKNHVYVRDHNHVVYDSRVDCIRHRIMTAVNQTDSLTIPLKFVRYFIEVMIEMYAVRVNEDLDSNETNMFWFMDSIKRHQKHGVRRRVQKISDKYQLDLDLRRRCECCGKIKGEIYNGKECIIKVCKCKECYVCSRICQKKMWKTHRDRCTRKRCKLNDSD